VLWFLVAGLAHIQIRPADFHTSMYAYYYST